MANRREFLRSFRREFQKISLESMVVVIVTAGVTYVLLSINWENRQFWLKALATFTISWLVKMLSGMAISSSEKAYVLEQERDSVDAESEEHRIRAKGLEDNLRRESDIIAGFNQYFGRINLPELKSQSDNIYLQQIRKEHLDAAETLVNLVEKGRSYSTYRRQLELAAVIAGTATKYFWATSLDPLSDFQRRNYYYLKTLTTMRERLPAVADGALPPVARIFVGRIEDFLEGIRNESEAVRVLDLYEWHIQWNKSSSADTAIRFFCYKNARTKVEYRELFRLSEIKNEDIIEDFMIVDESLVYGRRAIHDEDEVELALIRDRTVVAAYEKLYPALWDDSLTMQKLLTRMEDLERPATDAKLEAFRKQCEKRESKAALERDYEKDFAERQREGVEFFERVCVLIEKSQGFCFALDAADRKGINLIKTWSDEPYRRFKEASKKAATNGARFQRLFVIQEPLNCQPEEARAFIEDFVNSANMTIGFIFASECNLESLTYKFDTDFIVTNVMDPTFKNFGDAFGFELQDKEFDINSLSWKEHLIAKRRMGEHYAVFNKLWENNPATVKVANSDKASVGKAIDKLLGGSQKNARA